MGETTGTRDGPDMNDDTTMDARSAAGIMRDAERIARRELTVNTPALLLAWGLMYLLGYGVLWLGSRGQHPYQGPPGWSLGVLTGIVAITVITLAAIVNRATSGVSGESARRRRIEYICVGAGLVAVFASEGGFRGAGGSVTTTDLIGASGPILVYGLVLTGFGSAWGKRGDLGLGVWMIAVAAGSLFAGAATAWGIDAVAVAAGCLTVAAIQGRRSAAALQGGRSVPRRRLGRS